MNDEFNIEDFEQLLKTQSDKHRMFPNDQVWRNINKQLHGDSKWPALTFGAVFTGVILTMGLIFLHPNKSIFKFNDGLVVNSASQKISESSISKLLKPSYASNTVHLKPLANTANNYIFENGSATTCSTIDKLFLAKLDTPIEETITLNDPILLDKEASSNFQAINKPIGKVSESRNAIALISPLINIEPITENDNQIDSLTTTIPTESISNAEAEAKANVEKKDNGTFEKVAAFILPAKNKTPWSLQIYGGSSISYRLLTEPQNNEIHFPYNAALTGNPRADVNNFVKQKPAVGFEIGTALSYALNDRVKIKSGIQLNFRQYNIDAFDESNDQALLLFNRPNAAVDSMFYSTTIRNGSGNKPIALSNRYFQIGIPIGVDWTVANSNKLSVTLGANFQPTYQLNTDIYLLSSDYKNYSKQPSYVRRLNFNAGLEALLSFKTGTTQWQIGPQLRYQLLPTQISSYSIHEHLIDYGVRIGIIKQLR